MLVDGNEFGSSLFKTDVGMNLWAMLDIVICIHMNPILGSMSSTFYTAYTYGKSRYNCCVGWWFAKIVVYKERKGREPDSQGHERMWWMKI